MNRRAYELGYATAFMFAGARPKFDRVGEISFLRPVDVGDLLRLTSKVLQSANGPARVSMLRLRSYWDNLTNHVLLKALQPRSKATLWSC